MNKVVKYLLAVLVAVVFFFITSLWLFLASVPSLPSLPSVRQASAWQDGEQRVAIILTGSYDRLVSGLDLLEDGEVDFIFISGVYPKLKLEEFFRVMKASARSCGQIGKDCIELGHKARNTHQNACESFEWLQGRGINKFYLITSDYHYPRSLSEFRAIMSRLDYEVIIVPHITGSGLELWKKWSSEYIKWLIVKVRIFLENFFPKSSILSCFN